MMCNLSDYLEPIKPRSRPLPLVHSTSQAVFEFLTSEGKLSPQCCKVFGENLLYFFYGRPAYRSRHSMPTTAKDFLPVCMVVDQTAVEGNVFNTFPFDTGAAVNGLFEPYVKSANLSKFKMGEKLDNLPKAVDLFFGNNRNYFEGEPSKREIEELVPEAVSAYLDLVSLEGEALFDDRRSAMEIITTAEVPFNGYLKAVIATRQFLAKDGMEELIVKNWKAKALPYSSVRATIPSEYVRVVVEIMSVYLRDTGEL